MRILSSLLLAGLFPLGICQAQTRIDDPAVPPRFDLRPDSVGQLEFLGETMPLRDFVQDPNDVRPITRTMEEDEEEHDGRKVHRSDVRAAFPHGEDPAWQKANGTDTNHALDITQDGIANQPVSPADPVSDVGPNHVIQMCNQASGSFFRVYNKSGGVLINTTDFDAYMGTAAGLGDPIVVYDALADRWLMSEFASSGNHFIIAISTTPDPTGTWYKYNFTLSQFPDYPKYGVWNGMYIVTSNESLCAIYALDRTKMLVGDQTATFQRFTSPHYGTIGFQAVAPVTFDGGTPPPAGAPGMVMRMADDAWSGVGAGNDRLEMWTMSINWVTPASSVVSGPTYFPVTAFDSSVGGYVNFSGVTQQGSANTLDPIREVLMNRVQYRNISGYEAIVCSHVADVGSDHAGVRWYEMHRLGGIANPWSIYQQGTYAPDALNRWISGIAINDYGDIGLSYNVAGSTAYPGIRYTGRHAGDPLGTMTISETSVVAGAAAQTGTTRWGDYASLDVDPSTGSFWGTACYTPTSAWRTRLFSFSIPPNAINVSPKVFLEGPYTAGLMSDALRAASLIPATEPYTSMGYTYVGGGTSTVTPAVLAVTGSNAIVDWVVVELRSSANSSTVVASKPALVQADGDVVGVDGTSPVSFVMPAASYFVAVRHRNHLGIMTLAAVGLTNTTSTVDFTAAATSVYGTEPRKDVSGIQVMWAGDVTFNHQLKYTGAGNDRDPILARIGGTVTTAVVTGYYPEDVNMTGEVKYTGSANDRDKILENIGGLVPSNTRTEQLP